MSAPVQLNSLFTKEVSVIDGSTTAPTKGSPAVDLLTYVVMGPVMLLNWQFEEDTGAEAGSGAYLLKIPGGYSIQSDFVSIGTGTHANIVGSCSVIDSAGTPVDLQGYVIAYNATHVAMVVNKSLIGSAHLGLDSSDAPVKYSLQAVLPIAGRNYLY